MVCEYYCATLKSETVWIVVATLRYVEHCAFDRTLDTQKSIFEFYVPAAMEPLFCQLMESFIERGYVSDLVKKENRLLNHEASL
jgi:hypothetical protein